MKEQNTPFDNIQLPDNKQECNEPHEVDVDANTLKEQIKIRYVHDTKHRKILVIWMIATVSIWLVFTGTIVALEFRKGQLSDNVLIALLTTTTANVLGLAVIVLRGLFNVRE